MQLETDLQLGEVALIVGGIIVIGYFVNKAAKAASNIIGDAATATKNEVTTVAGGLNTYNPFSDSHDNVTTAPPSFPTTQGVPVGYNWQTGQIDYNMPFVDGMSVNDLLAAGYSTNDIAQIWSYQFPSTSANLVYNPASDPLYGIGAVVP